MIYSLKGKLTYIEAAAAVVECAGVGYFCNITLTTCADLRDYLNQEVLLYTHLNVREDAVTLFGFSQKFELECFKLLTTVSGVGAKVGLTILSSMAPEQILSAIVSGNAKLLTCAPGVGNKLAQRIVLELKDKVDKMQTSELSEISSIASNFVLSGNAQKATDALMALGYSQADVQKVLLNLDASLPVEELIKAALKALSSRM